MDVPGERKPRESGTYGRLSHGRYAHERRPTRLAVACPRCGARATAVEGDGSDPMGISVDGGPDNYTVARSGEYADPPVWSVRCSAAPHRTEGLRWDDLGEPWFQVEARGEVLWAWNEDHLRFLRDVLAGTNVSGHPYAPLATYVRGAWKKHAEDFVKAIDGVLAEEG